MAGMNIDPPPEPDVVTCVCGRQWDRNIYSQCRNCLTNLWDLERATPIPPARESTPAAHDTFLERASPSERGIDVLVCGRRLTIVDGQALRLGRQDDFETAEVFREAINVSRAHAVLRFDSGRVYVTDTRSSNGTYVDGQPLPPDHEYEIRQGQTLRLASNVAVDLLWEGQ